MSRITAVCSTRGAAPSHSPPDMTYAPGAKLAHGLGWFSFALGLTQFLAPRMIGRATGVQNTELIQCCGVREIASGIAVLGCSRPSVAMWTRVAGDAMDLAVLSGAIWGSKRRPKTQAATATVAVVAVMALDVYAASQLTAAKRLEG